MGTASKIIRLPSWSGRLILAILFTAGLAGIGLAPAHAAPRSAPAPRNAPAAVPAAAAPSTGINAGSSLCLDDPNSQTTTGVQLIQWTCNGGTNQNWTFNLVAGTTATYTISSFAGLCVDISGRSTASGGQVIQWTCNSQTNQEFTAQPVTVSGKTNTFNLVSVNSGLCIAPTGDSTASNTLLVQLSCTTATTRVWQVSGIAGGGGGGGTGGFQGLPNVAPNACNSTTLPKAYGTNFPVPSDPNGQGFANETAMGWDGNFWPVIGYLSGSFFARGVVNTYTAGSTSYCGAMYTFSAYDFGGAPGAGSVQWTEDSGYLPAMTTTRTSGSVGISIKDFADKVTIAGNPFMLMYVRVAVTNNGTTAVSVPARRVRPEPDPADQHLAQHGPARRDQ